MRERTIPAQIPTEILVREETKPTVTSTEIVVRVSKSNNRDDVRQGIDCGRFPKKIRKGLLTVIKRLPDEAIDKLIEKRPGSLYLNKEFLALPFDFINPMIVIHSTLEKQPLEVIMGILVQGMACIVLQNGVPWDEEKPTVLIPPWAEKEADALAIEWGFKLEVDSLHKKLRS